METKGVGRKVWVTAVGLACIMALTWGAMLLQQPVPDAAIAAIATIVLAYNGANVGATYAHASQSSNARTVNEAIQRQIVERRQLGAEDGTEPTD